MAAARSQLQLICSFRSPVFVIMDPRYLKEFRNFTAVVPAVMGDGSGPSPMCIRLVFSQLM